MDSRTWLIDCWMDECINEWMLSDNGCRFIYFLIFLNFFLRRDISIAWPRAMDVNFQMCNSKKDNCKNWIRPPAPPIYLKCRSAHQNQNTRTRPYISNLWECDSEGVAPFTLAPMFHFIQAWAKIPHHQNLSFVTRRHEGLHPPSLKVRGSSDLSIYLQSSVAITFVWEIMICSIFGLFLSVF